MKINIGIIQNSNKQILITKSIINNFYMHSSNNINIYTTDCFKEYFTYFMHHNIDILITEINLNNDQHNAIEYIKQVNILSPDTKVIYLADNLNYIEAAYATNHIYYLLKRNINSQLQQALSLAGQKIDNKKDDLFTFSFNRKIYSIDNNSIVYIQKNLRKVDIYCKYSDYIKDLGEIVNTSNDLLVITIYAKFDDLLKQLPDTFLQVHRSYCININYIYSIKENEIDLINGYSIPLSTTFKSMVLDLT